MSGHKTGALELNQPVVVSTHSVGQPQTVGQLIAISPESQVRPRRVKLVHGIYCWSRELR